MREKFLFCEFKENKSPEDISSQNLKLMELSCRLHMDITRLPEKHSFPLKHILMSVYAGSVFDVIIIIFNLVGTAEHISM